MNRNIYSSRLANVIGGITIKLFQGSSINESIRSNTYLYLISGHPYHLEKYVTLFSVKGLIKDILISLQGVCITTYKIFSALFRLNLLPPKYKSLDNNDVLIVTHLVNLKHLKNEDDFYFGNLQKYLKEEKIKTLKVYLNQINERLVESSGDIVLNNTLSFFQEINLLLTSISGFLFLLLKSINSKKFHKHFYLRAALYSFSSATMANLRINSQLILILKKVAPKIVFTTWEGNAWERHFFYTSHQINPNTFCIGYQHSILVPSTFSLFKSYEFKSDPDLILTSGEINKKIFQSKSTFPNLTFLIYGTHKFKTYSIKAKEYQSKNILVTPEGIVSECLLLISFVLESALLCPEFNFILRFHPAFSLSELKKVSNKFNKFPSNCYFSENDNIVNDYQRCDYILYRGSSTAIHAIAFGIKPIYLNNEDDFSIDPLYLLNTWKDIVDSPKKLQFILYQNLNIFNKSDFLNAINFYKNYIVEENFLELKKIISNKILLN